MSDIVDADRIEQIVGRARHETEHYGRWVSAQGRLYVLHSVQCVATHPDLRTCAFSLALDDAGGFPPDQTVPLRVVPGLYPSLIPAWPALTLEEFVAGAPGTYAGIALCEDEDGAYVFAWGHHDPAGFAAAVDVYDREMTGEAEHTPTPDQVRHHYALTRDPADSPDGWFIAWDTAITADTPGAFPLTVVTR